MASQVEICNLALTHIGQKPITSITEPIESARRLKLVFDVARDTVLEAHEWNFATRVEALALISGESVPGWEYLYKLPAKCLYPRKVFTEATLKQPKPTEFEVMTSPVTQVMVIATNLEDAFLKYTKKVVDVSLFTPAAVVALSHLLASLVAVPLCGKKDVADTQYTKYLLAVGEAKRLNASINKSEPNESSSFIDER
jgi:hypothetical protein